MVFGHWSSQNFLPWKGHSMFTGYLRSKFKDFIQISVVLFYLGMQCGLLDDGSDGKSYSWLKEILRRTFLKSPIVTIRKGFWMS